MAAMRIPVDLRDARLIATSEPREAKGGYGAPAGWQLDVLMMRDGRSTLLKVTLPDCPTVEPGEAVELEDPATVKLELVAEAISTVNDRETGKPKDKPHEWGPREAAA